MIKRAEEMKTAVKVNMRDGDGQVVVTNILESGEYKGIEYCTGCRYFN